jgi:hypothetical protein
VQELRDKGHHVMMFIETNEDEFHRFIPQEHNVKLTTKKGFHIDGAIDGSLWNLMANCSMINVVSELNEGEMPNTHNIGSRQIDSRLIT